MTTPGAVRSLPNGTGMEIGIGRKPWLGGGGGGAISMNSTGRGGRKYSGGGGGGG